MTALKAKIIFHNAIFKADEEVVVTSFLRNDSPKLDEKEAISNGIPIYGIQLIIGHNGEEDNQSKFVQEVTWTGNVLLEPGQNHVEKFSFKPKAENVDKQLVVEKAVIEIGNEKGLKMKIHQMVPKENADAQRFKLDFPYFKSK